MKEAHLRAYGHWHPVPENVERCVARVSSGARGFDSHQCGRKRGHGEGGLYCAQHAKSPWSMDPKPGTWGREHLERLRKQRAPIAEAAAKLEAIDREIAALESDLAELP